MKIIEGISLKRILLIIFFLLLLPIVSVWIMVTQPILSKSRPSSIEVEKSKLKDHVLTFSQRYHPRNSSNIKNLNLCAEYISEHFKKAGLKTSFQEFTVLDKTYKNVIGFLGPETNERIVIGAHYDSYEDTPGADDNASAVAGLIELAYLFGKEKVGTELEFVAYTLEEPPFFGTSEMGSIFHAKSLHDQKINVKIMIALEMIGYFSDKKNSQSYPLPLLEFYYPNRGNFILLVGRLDQRNITRKIKGFMKGATDLPICSINAPSSIVGIDYSDHSSYWEYGYNAVMITDTAFYRNQQYHKKGDTADRLDYERMGKVVVQVFEGINGILKEMAEQTN